MSDQPHEEPATPQREGDIQTNEEPPEQKTPQQADQNTTKKKNMDNLLNKIPNMAPAGPLGTQTKGPLSALGDPIGQALAYSLQPLGHVTGAVGNPHGETLLRVQRVAAHEGVAAGEPKYLADRDNGKSDAELPGGERVGGKAQTGENPLGL